MNINRFVLPGIPFAYPEGGPVEYILRHLVIGAVLGLISAIPESMWAGGVLGGVVGAGYFFFTAFSSAGGDPAPFRTVFFALGLRRSHSFHALCLVCAFLRPRTRNNRRGNKSRFLYPVASRSGVVLGFSPSMARMCARDFRPFIRFCSNQNCHQHGGLPGSLQGVESCRACQPPYTWNTRIISQPIMEPFRPVSEMSSYLIPSGMRMDFRFMCLIGRMITTACLTRKKNRPPAAVKLIVLHGTRLHTGLFYSGRS